MSRTPQPRVTTSDALRRAWAKRQDHRRARYSGRSELSELLAEAVEPEAEPWEGFDPQAEREESEAWTWYLDQLYPELPQDSWPWEPWTPIYGGI